MRIRSLVNHYLKTNSFYIGLEGVTHVFFNPFTQGRTKYEFDDTDTALNQDMEVIKPSMEKATDIYERKQ